MKIEITRGCMSDAISIDGQIVHHIEDDNLRKLKEIEVLDYLLPKIKEHVLMGCINLHKVIDLFQYSDEEDLGECDQCGDNVYKTTWEL